VLSGLHDPTAQTDSAAIATCEPFPSSALVMREIFTVLATPIKMLGGKSFRLQFDGASLHPLCTGSPLDFIAKAEGE